jgi:hypothetical protein
VSILRRRPFNDDEDDVSGGGDGDHDDHDTDGGYQSPTPTRATDVEL